MQNEFRIAAFAECAGKCSSDEARAFFANISEAVNQHEAKSRKNMRRGAMAERFTRTVEGFIAELLLATRTSSASAWLYRPLARTKFKVATVTHADFMAAIAALRKLGFIDHSPGYQRFGPGFEGQTVNYTGSSTRWRASDAMLRVAATNGITPESVADHFRYGLPKDPLVVRATASKGAHGKNTQGSLLEILWSAEALKLRADVQRLNEFLDATEIRGGVHRGYVRIFNNGDAPGFAWNKGGRLYSVGGGYQQMSEPERLKITLNGQQVVEVDARASYLTILHGLCGVPFDTDSDPYNVPGIPRDVVKHWLTASLGSEQLIRKWPPESVRDALEKGINLRDYKPSAVKNVMVAKHPLLAGWADLKVTWADLMYIESKAIMDTMLMLMEGGCVPTLAMHDGLLVPERFRDIAVRMLKSNYSEHCSATPTITVAYPLGHALAS
ncbi:MAG: hypothetical protein JWN71_4177 [Xanthobacteraceae bacterium]|nr:hypothetical protein [Xanthobacteraceae bacterium]